MGEVGGAQVLKERATVGGGLVTALNVNEGLRGEPWGVHRCLRTPLGGIMNRTWLEDHRQREAAAGLSGPMWSKARLNEQRAKDLPMNGSKWTYWALWPNYTVPEPIFLLYIPYCALPFQASSHVSWSRSTGHPPGFKVNVSLFVILQINTFLYV